MSKYLRWAKVAAVVAAFALVVAACGGGSGDEAAPSPTVADVGTASPNGDAAILPPNPDADDTPPIGATCLVGEPDCNDTMLPGEEPRDLPLPSDDEPGSMDDPVVGLGAVVDGGLTVAQALSTDATGILAVQGFLLDDGSGFKLCELLAESYPPQCGGASVRISGFEEVLGTPLANAQGVSWTDSTVTFFGELVDGTFVVDPFVAG